MNKTYHFHLDEQLCIWYFPPEQAHKQVTKLPRNECVCSEVYLQGQSLWWLKPSFPIACASIIDELHFAFELGRVQITFITTVGGICHSIKLKHNWWTKPKLKVRYLTTNICWIYHKQNNVMLFRPAGRECRREWNQYLARKISLFTWSRQNCQVIVTSSVIDCDVIGRTKTERVRHEDDV